MTSTGPARNRVTPRGEIVAVAGRGAWMGNRGRLHEGRGARDIVRNHQTKTWIILGPRLYGQTMGYLPTAIARRRFGGWVSATRRTS
ncbi:hypothetical protein [Mycobacterium sp.]|uniref:hypothetical protein n=1 Tax=Mycobacterium sp. TaxID=1785 RepID=UPI003F996AFD